MASHACMHMHSCTRTCTRTGAHKLAHEHGRTRANNLARAPIRAYVSTSTVHICTWIGAPVDTYAYCCAHVYKCIDMMYPNVRRYTSVRAGPHRPNLSGPGESGLDASVFHVVYEKELMYPAYVIEVELHVDDSEDVFGIASAAEQPSSTTLSACASSSSSAVAGRPVSTYSSPAPFTPRSRAS